MPRTRSILPNSEPRILLPFTCRQGKFQVRWIEEEDSHALFFQSTGADAWLRIAGHHNGYSCEHLGRRIIGVWRGHTEPDAALRQYDYILLCGGSYGIEADDLRHFIGHGVTQATGPARLVWSTEADHHAPKGLRYVLRTDAFPAKHFSALCADDRVAVCSYDGDRKWCAAFWLHYDGIKVVRGTAKAAIKALEDILDKRSIGIFGADVITFEAAQ